MTLDKYQAALAATQDQWTIDESSTMIERASPISDPFSEYVRLLLQLHCLMSAGEGDTDETEEIRDQMDYPWPYLNTEQLDLVRGLSADLYTIGVDRDKTQAESPEELWKNWKQVTRAVERHDWQTALTMLRVCEPYLPPPSVAAIRAACWAALEQFHVAIEFLKEVARLQPLSADDETLLLNCLNRAGHLQEAESRVANIRHEETNPALLLAGAKVLSLRATQLDPASANRLRRSAIDMAERALTLAAEASPEQGCTVDRVAASLHLASNYEALGESQQARQACGEALRLEPGNLDALVLDAWLRHETDPELAQEEFRKGFLYRLPHDTPFPIPPVLFASPE
ncbi:MAG: hypothetical protein KY475_24090 [Planctomycetes bacterium]|nr:hypothetical protein [Planctomycetota bacterium]